jgi:hypothetical protein
MTPLTDKDELTTRIDIDAEYNRVITIVDNRIRLLNRTAFPYFGYRKSYALASVFLLTFPCSASYIEGI